MGGEHYALYLLTVGVTQGLAGTAESVLGVVLLASAVGLLLSCLVLPWGDRVAAIRDGGRRGRPASEEHQASALPMNRR
jgi:hypothetical protein